MSPGVPKGSGPSISPSPIPAHCSIGGTASEASQKPAELGRADGTVARFAEDDLLYS